MIKLNGKYYGFIPFEDYWFTNDLDTLEKTLNRNSNVFIYQSSINMNFQKNGIAKKEFTTGIISLKEDLEKIFKTFSQTTRNEIKKIIRLIKGENISSFISNEHSIEIEYLSSFGDGLNNEYIIKFIKFYNIFALNKGLVLLKKQIFKKYLNNIVISKVTNNGEEILYHVYLKDKEYGVLRLLYSASLFRKSKQDNRKLIGWINNYQHYKDIEYGKIKGYNIYDFGGVFLGDTGNNEDLIEQKKIANFKMKFKPEIITQYNYTKESGLYFILKIIYKKIF